MDRKPQHYLGFNGLRAVAVTLVFLLHKTHETSLELGKEGVWLFFFISGFLIIGELHRARLATESGHGSSESAIATFFVKRALRIFPIYYILLTVLFLGRRFYEHAGPNIGFIWHFTYLSNFWMAIGAKSWLGPFSHLWSLAVEQQFYLFAPFALLLSPSKTHRMLCAFCVLAGVVGHVTLFAADASEVVVHTITPFSLSLLAAGGWMYFATRNRLRMPLPGVLAGSALVAVFGAWPILFSHAPAMAQAGFDIALAVGLALIFFYVATNQESALTRSLEWKPLNYLGTISYGFYLFHNFIPNPLGKALQLYAHIQLPEMAQETLGIACNYGLTVIVAGLSWRFIEKPVLQFGRRFLKSAKPVEVQVPVAPIS
jgi:peptidoglycan/LPS O-acetylase OafA/YrhL